MLRIFGKRVLQGLITRANLGTEAINFEPLFFGSLKPARSVGNAEKLQTLSSPQENDMLDCLEVNFSTIDCTDVKDSVKLESFDQELIDDIECFKPDVVFVKKLQESHYWKKLMSEMKHLGYRGSFEDAKQGRGQGVFVRTDLLETDKIQNVYRSHLPNPTN